MRGRLVSIASGRRSRWAVLAGWAVAASLLGLVAGRLHETTSSDALSLLPGGAESARAAAALAGDFPTAPDTPALVVYQDLEGLDDQDFEAIASQITLLLTRLEGVEEVDLTALAEARAEGGAGEARVGNVLEDALPGGQLVSRNRTTLLVPIPIETTDMHVVERAVEEIRDVVEAGLPARLNAYVTGPAGLDVDSSRILGDLGPTLLVASMAFILLLLAAIYRSVLAPLLPIVTVGVAYAVAAGIIRLAVDALDVPLSSQATSLLVILMFGVGTDYCVYLLARYREELAGGADPLSALRAATSKGAGAVVSCGATVVGAMLVLLVADLESTRTLGPVLAAGVAITMLAALTLLPALLAVLGGVTFWPRRPQPRTSPGAWTRIGRAVVSRPGLLAVACVVLLGALTAGSAANLGALPVNDGFRDKTDSLEGAVAIERAFPAGEIAPTRVVVLAPRGALAGAAERVASALRRERAVADVRENGVDPAGTAAALTAVLAVDPFSDAALDAIPGLRQGVDDAVAGTGATVLVGGATAAEYDASQAVSADAKLILPITLAVVFSVLVALLRALVAPLYLILTVVLSYAATLGLTSICLKWLFGAPGLMVGFSTFLFLFVVALGVDYNVFLMSRIREESARAGMHDAVRRGLEATGSVITTAGVILGGTFAMAMIAPLWQLFQLGFAVATGVLIDTLLVRTVLVPAITRLLGDRAWWPGHAGRRGAPVSGAAGT